MDCLRHAAGPALLLVALGWLVPASAEITGSGSTLHRHPDGRDWKFAPHHHERGGVGQRLERRQSFGLQRHDDPAGGGTALPFSQRRGIGSHGDGRRGQDGGPGARHGHGRGHPDRHDGYGTHPYGQRHGIYGSPYYGPYARPYGNPYGRSHDRGYVDPRPSYGRPHNPYDAYDPNRRGRSGAYSGPPPGRGYSTVPRLVPRDGRRH